MELSYKLSRSDLEMMGHLDKKLTDALSDKSWALRAITGIFAFAALVALFMIYEIYRLDRDAGPFNVLMFSFAVMVAAVAAWIKVDSNRNRRLLEELIGPYPIDMKLSINDEGLGLSGTDGTRLWPWENVISVEEIPTRIAIQLRNRSHAVVPNAAFDTEQQRQQFLDEIRNRLGV